MFYLVQKTEDLWGLFDENEQQHPVGLQTLGFWNQHLNGRKDIELMPLPPLPFEMPQAPDIAQQLSAEALLLNFEQPLHILEEDPLPDSEMFPVPVQMPTVESSSMILNQWQQQRSQSNVNPEQIDQDNVFLIHPFELDNSEVILDFAETFDDNISGLTAPKSDIAKDVTEKTNALVKVANKIANRKQLDARDERILAHFKSDIHYAYKNREILHHVGLQFPQLRFSSQQPYRVVLVAHGGGYNEHDDKLYNANNDELTVEDICNSDLIDVLRNASYVKCIGCGNYRFAEKLSQHLPGVNVAGYTMDVGTNKAQGRYDVAHNELLKDGKFPPRSSVKKVYQNGKEVPLYLKDEQHHFRQMSKFKP